MADANGSAGARLCVNCGVEFSNKDKRKVLCSVKCAGQARRLPGAKDGLVCEWCDKPFWRNKRGNDERKFCTHSCAMSFKSAFGRSGNLIGRFSQIWAAHCSECGNPFVSRREKSYCSAACLAGLNRRKARQWGESRKVVTARACKQCGVSFAPEYGNMRRTFCSKPCQKRHARRGKSKNHEARAKAFGVERKHFNTLRIFQRDNWTCQLCGVKTPSRLKGTQDDRAPELDHILPLSQGGGHVQENVQCACRKCNSDKGARPLGQMWLLGIADTLVVDTPARGLPIPTVGCTVTDRKSVV